MLEIVNMRRIVVAALVIVAATYAVYFFARYASFGLLIDHESIAIEEILRARIAPGRAEPSVVGPNRAIGCSFLLLEEMWRDCKAVRVPIISGELSLAQKQIISETVAAPCRWVELAKKNAASLYLDKLQCTEVSRPFVATLYTMQHGERIIIATIAGEFVE